jgi:dTDP-4-dehydrorhamnose reductase
VQHDGLSRKGQTMSNGQRVVVLGSRGMAGHMILRHLSILQDYEVIGVDRASTPLFVRRQVDVEDPSLLADVLKKAQPTVVVNCIGVLNTACDRDPARAVFLNSYLPQRLARMGDEQGFKLIHLSTDCVFSGVTGGYTEASEPDGISLYARTKALGEVSSARHLTFRTSIIGPELEREGPGLLEWFLRQTGPVPGYASVLWTGVTTLELAKAVHVAIEENLCGLYHLVPDTSISKSDLLLETARAFDVQDVQVVPQATPRCRRTLVCTRTDFSFHVQGYHAMLDELAAAIKAMPDLRWA